MKPKDWSTDMAVQMFLVGHSYRDIGKAFGVQWATVRSRLIEARLQSLEKTVLYQQETIAGLQAIILAPKEPVQVPGWIMPSEKDIAISRAQQGRSIDEIVVELGISKDKVIDILARARRNERAAA